MYRMPIGDDIVKRQCPSDGLVSVEILAVEARRVGFEVLEPGQRTRKGFPVPIGGLILVSYLGWKIHRQGLRLSIQRTYEARAVLPQIVWTFSQAGILIEFSPHLKEIAREDDIHADDLPKWYGHEWRLLRRLGYEPKEVSIFS